MNKINCKFMLQIQYIWYKNCVSFRTKIINYSIHVNPSKSIFAILTASEEHQWSQYCPTFTFWRKFKYTFVCTCIWITRIRSMNLMCMVFWNKLFSFQWYFFRYTLVCAFIKNTCIVLTDLHNRDWVQRYTRTIQLNPFFLSYCKGFLLIRAYNTKFSRINLSLIRYVWFFGVLVSIQSTSSLLDVTSLDGRTNKIASLRSC